MTRLILVLLATLAVGCVESVSIRSTPPDAKVFIDNRLVGTTPTEFETRDVRPLPYRIEKPGYPTAEGTLSTPIAPGRVIGAVFTLGILTIFRPMRYFIPNPLDVTLGPAGAKLEDGPESVWKEYKCGKKNLPFIAIEKNELTPPRVKPGQEIKHRLVYVACTGERAGVIRGTLHRRIYFKAEVIEDTVSQYEVQPGRWTLDAFTTVPNETEPGVYVLEVEFDTPKARFRKVESFQVE